MLPRKFYIDDIFDSLLESEKNNMRCDIYEENNKYIAEIDLPGFKKDEIKIECNKGNLIITAEKKIEEESKDKKYIRRERSFGKYSRSIYLGDIDDENISANYTDGTLKITIPKIDEEKNKKYIDIV